MSAALLAGGEARPVAVPLAPGWLGQMLAPGRAGVYLLPARGRPVYVGRSDSCLLRRLLGHPLRAVASHAAWILCPGALSAFRAECYWYHRLRDGPGMLNRHHPASPALASQACPFCGSGIEAAAGAVAWLSGIGRADGGSIRPGAAGGPL